MAAPKQNDESVILEQLGAAWESAKQDLAHMRQAVEQVSVLGKAQAELTRARTDREAALLKLGEAVLTSVERGDLSVPPALKRLVGEVKVKDAELLRQKADIAAILREADALAEKNRKATPAKKKGR